MALKSIVGKWIDFRNLMEIASIGCFLKTVGPLHKKKMSKIRIPFSVLKISVLTGIMLIKVRIRNVTSR